LEPAEKAIYNFFLAMEADRNIGGVCGFMGLRVENVFDDSGSRSIIIIIIYFIK
jgi:chitin synthase